MLSCDNCLKMMFVRDKWTVYCETKSNENNSFSDLCSPHLIPLPPSCSTSVPPIISISFYFETMRLLLLFDGKLDKFMCKFRFMKCSKAAFLSKISPWNVAFEKKVVDFWSNVLHWKQAVTSCLFQKTSCKFLLYQSLSLKISSIALLR